jgi:hypothetical protein
MPPLRQLEADSHPDMKWTLKPDTPIPHGVVMDVGTLRVPKGNPAPAAGDLVDFGGHIFKMTAIVDDDQTWLVSMEPLREFG